MVRTHPSTPEQRAQWAATMLVHQGQYGLVTRLSRLSGVSRPTLYSWRARAEQALLRVFEPAPAPVPALPALQRQVLTLWISHASERHIQNCLSVLTGQYVSLDHISAILHDAQQRALGWVATHAPPGVRALALDEIYANNRHGAYLNVVDVHSGAVWASEGPLPVDSESWTLVLWSLQERGVRWERVVKDDGAAMQAACRTVTPDLSVQLDQWHSLHTCAQVQARLERVVRDLRARTVVIERQARRLAAGHKPLGRNSSTDLAGHLAELAQAEAVAEAVRFLTHELRRLLDVVVLDRRGLLTPVQRHADLAAGLALLAELAATAPVRQQSDVQRLHATLAAALPQLQSFVVPIAQVQHDLLSVLPAEEQQLLAWAWLRRKVLQWSSQDIVAATPQHWQAAARVLLAAWDDAVRVSSAVERWHSILRPHLAVHRSLTSGMLALLMVWHNHRVFSRGVHAGKSPLDLSGISDAPTDWMEALGYPAIEIVTPQATASLALAA